MQGHRSATSIPDPRQLVQGALNNAGPAGTCLFAIGTLCVFGGVLADAAHFILVGGAVAVLGGTILVVLKSS